MSSTSQLTAIAWATGFFDGEGSVAIEHNKKSNSIGAIASLGNTNIDSLYQLQKLFGGSIHTRNLKYPGSKPLHVWKLGAKASEKFFKAILPYSIVKTKQIELAIKSRQYKQQQVFSLTRNTEELLKIKAEVQRLNRAA